MKALIVIVLSIGTVCAQSPTTPSGTPTPGTNSLKVVGNPTYVQLSYSPAGGLIVEPVTALVNVAAARVTGGGLTLVGTQSCPICPPVPVLPTDSFMITLTKSTTPATDTWAGLETWCSGTSLTNGASVTSIGAWAVSTVTETQTSAAGLTPMTWTFEETGRVNNPATTTNPGMTVTSPPAWEKNRPECGGAPALMMTPPATAYNSPNIQPPIPTYVRNSVQVVVVQ